MLNVFVNLLSFTRRATGVSGSVRGEYPSHRVGPSPAKPTLATLLLLLGFCLSFFVAPAACAVDIRGGNYDVGVYFREVVKGGFKYTPADRYYLNDGVYYLWPGYTYYFRVSVYVDSTLWKVTITPDPLVVTATVPEPWPTTNTVLPRQSIHVKLEERDGAEAVVEFDVPIDIAVLPPFATVPPRLVTHDPVYEKNRVLSLKGTSLNGEVKQVEVMVDNMVTVKARMPPGYDRLCLVDGTATWMCDAVDQGMPSGELYVVYEFHTNAQRWEAGPATLNGQTMVDDELVPPANYNVAFCRDVVRYPAHCEIIQPHGLVGALKVGPLIKTLAFAPAIDTATPNATPPAMHTLCPYSPPVSLPVIKNGTSESQTGYGLDIKYYLDDDLNNKKGQVVLKFMGGDCGGKTLGEFKKDVLELPGDVHAKWEGYDASIPENADEIYLFPNQVVTGDWVAPLRVVKEANDYEHRIDATLNSDPTQMQKFKIKFEVKYEVE